MEVPVKVTWVHPNIAGSASGGCGLDVHGRIATRDFLDEPRTSLGQSQKKGVFVTANRKVE